MVVLTNPEVEQREDLENQFLHQQLGQQVLLLTQEELYQYQLDLIQFLLEQMLHLSHQYVRKEMLVDQQVILQFRQQAVVDQAEDTAARDVFFLVDLAVAADQVEDIHQIQELLVDLEMQEVTHHLKDKMVIGTAEVELLLQEDQRDQEMELEQLLLWHKIL